MEIDVTQAEGSMLKGFLEVVKTGEGVGMGKR